MAEEIYYCQIRLKAHSCEPGPWRTMESATRKGAEAWRKQVAPRKRKQGYETRVVREAV